MPATSSSPHRVSSPPKRSGSPSFESSQPRPSKRAHVADTDHTHGESGSGSAIVNPAATAGKGKAVEDARMKLAGYINVPAALAAKMDVDELEGVGEDEEEDGDDGMDGLAGPSRKDKGKGKALPTLELPEQVWTRVLEHYYDMVCQDWQSDNSLHGALTPLLLSSNLLAVSLPVLYRHPHLNYRALPKFLRCVQMPLRYDMGNKVSLVRHLTLRPSQSPSVAEKSEAVAPHVAGSESQVTRQDDHLTRWSRISSWGFRNDQSPATNGTDPYNSSTHTGSASANNTATDRLATPTSPLYRYTIHTSLYEICRLFPKLNTFTLKDTLVRHWSDAKLLFGSLKQIQPKKARLEIRMWDLADSPLGRDLQVASSPNVHADFSDTFVVGPRARQGNGVLDSDAEMMLAWKQALNYGGELHLPAWWIERPSGPTPNFAAAAAAAAGQGPVGMQVGQGGQGGLGGLGGLGGPGGQGGLGGLGGLGGQGGQFGQGAAGGMGGNLPSHGGMGRGPLIWDGPQQGAGSAPAQGHATGHGIAWHGGSTARIVHYDINGTDVTNVTVVGTNVSTTTAGPSSAPDNAPGPSNIAPTRINDVDASDDGDDDDDDDDDDSDLDDQSAQPSVADYGGMIPAPFYLGAGVVPPASAPVPGMMDNMDQETFTRLTRMFNAQMRSGAFASHTNNAAASTATPAASTSTAATTNAAQTTNHESDDDLDWFPQDSIFPRLPVQRRPDRPTFSIVERERTLDRMRRQRGLHRPSNGVAFSQFELDQIHQLKTALATVCSLAETATTSSVPAPILQLDRDQALQDAGQVMGDRRPFAAAFGRLRQRMIVTRGGGVAGRTGGRGHGHLASGLTPGLEAGSSAVGRSSTRPTPSEDAPTPVDVVDASLRSMRMDHLLQVVQRGSSHTSSTTQVHGQNHDSHTATTAAATGVVPGPRPPASRSIDAADNDDQDQRITYLGATGYALAHEMRGMLLKLLERHWCTDIQAFAFVALDPVASLIVRDPRLELWLKSPIPHIRVHLPRGVNSLAVFKDAKTCARDRARAASRGDGEVGNDNAPAGAGPMGVPPGNGIGQQHGGNDNATGGASAEGEIQYVGGDGQGGELVHDDTRLFEIEVNTLQEMANDVGWHRAGGQLPPQVCRIMTNSRDHDWRDVRVGPSRFSPNYVMETQAPLSPSPSSSRFISPTFSFIDGEGDDDDISLLGEDAIGGEGDNAGESYDVEAARAQKRALEARKKSG